MKKTVRKEDLRAVSDKENAKLEANEAPDEDARLFLDYMSRKRIRTSSGSAADVCVKRGRTDKKTHRSGIERIDLEGGRPGAGEAVRIMEVRLTRFRMCGVSFVKLVHGYGSSGRGGAIREAVRLRLAEMKKGGLIRDFIPGEDFGAFCVPVRMHPEWISVLSKDHDYENSNPGITIVIM